MKNNQILIVVGVIALVLIIANWNKIFGKTDKKRMGGQVRPSLGGQPKGTGPVYTQHYICQDHDAVSGKCVRCLRWNDDGSQTVIIQSTDPTSEWMKKCQNL